MGQKNVVFYHDYPKPQTSLVTRQKLRVWMDGILTLFRFNTIILSPISVSAELHCVSMQRALFLVIEPKSYKSVTMMGL